MDPQKLTILNTIVTIISILVSIVCAIIAIYQAYKASKHAKKANEIRDYNDFGQAPKVCPEKFTGVKKTAKGLEFEMPAASIITLEIR